MRKPLQSYSELWNRPPKAEKARPTQAQIYDQEASATDNCSGGDAMMESCLFRRHRYVVSGIISMRFHPPKHLGTEA